MHAAHRRTDDRHNPIDSLRAEDVSRVPSGRWVRGDCVRCGLCGEISPLCTRDVLHIRMIGFAWSVWFGLDSPG